MITRHGRKIVIAVVLEAVVYFRILILKSRNMRHFVVLLMAILLLGCGSKTESKSVSEVTQGAEVTEEVADTPTVMNAGDVITIPWRDGGVKFTFTEITKVMIPDGGYAVTIKMLINNESNYDFSTMEADWKLTDENNVEVPESGVYDLEWGNFGFPLFQLESVDAGFGKNTEVGYHLYSGIYRIYLSRFLMAYITV